MVCPEASRAITNAKKTHWWNLDVVHFKIFKIVHSMLNFHSVYTQKQSKVSPENSIKNLLESSRMKQMMKCSQQNCAWRGGNMRADNGGFWARRRMEGLRKSRALMGARWELAVDEDIYFRDKRNSVGLKSADECHSTSDVRSQLRRRIHRMQEDKKD